MHGCPVMGFMFTDVPAPANVPGKVPGVVGDTRFSGPWGKTSELEGFCTGRRREPCACASVAYSTSIKGSNIADTIRLRCFARIESLPSVCLKARCRTVQRNAAVRLWFHAALDNTPTNSRC